jgi:hypothetical protein
MGVTPNRQAGSATMADQDISRAAGRLPGYQNIRRQIDVQKPDVLIFFLLMRYWIVRIAQSW